MTSEKAIQDVLGVLRSDDASDQDGWQTVMTGEEARRPKSLTRVAITRAEVTFKNDTNLKSFLAVLESSDRRLAAISDAEVLYDWQRVMRKDLTVRFGVAWYHRDFFLSRRDAYRSEFHERLLKQFGLKPDDIRIEHIPL